MNTTKVTPIRAVIGPNSMPDPARLLMANTVLTLGRRSESAAVTTDDDFPRFDVLRRSLI